MLDKMPLAPAVPGEGPGAWAPATHSLSLSYCSVPRPPRLLHLKTALDLFPWGRPSQ